MSPGSITAGPAGNLHRGGNQASFRSTVSDTEVETLQVIFTHVKKFVLKSSYLYKLSLLSSWICKVHSVSV